jgi:hypothetical protein
LVEELVLISTELPSASAVSITVFRMVDELLPAVTGKPSKSSVPVVDWMETSYGSSSHMPPRPDVAPTSAARVTARR